MISRYKISKIYDELYMEYAALIKKHNPCEIKDGKCKMGRSCSEGLCCRGCKYLGINSYIDYLVACLVSLSFNKSMTNLCIKK